MFPTSFKRVACIGLGACALMALTQPTDRHPVALLDLADLLGDAQGFPPSLDGGGPAATGLDGRAVQAGAQYVGWNTVFAGSQR